MECCEVARVGKAAPVFTADGFDAVNGSFEKYSLDKYKGKYVVLFFYPGDFTFVCPTELVSLASLKEDFAEAGAQVFAVSTDSKFSHKAWDESELSKANGAPFPFPMLADRLGKIGAPYGIFDSEAGVDIRGVVIIDKEGAVQHIGINAGPLGRNPKEVLRITLALKEHTESGGKAIPACWIPGGETIEAKIENSGKMWNNYQAVIQKGIVQGGNWRVN
ncbi:selenocysteine-containing peroxiredoxin PrxU [Synergistales bacterium]|nr:selenocysteine-containing peroxiredoxin PrxU [Synergistales bacterium]